MHPDMPPEYVDRIVTGDARELSRRIPDGSVDLVFTDPIYSNIEDYRWLAEESARVLKADRACLAFCGIGFLPETLDALRAGGLSYRWTLAANYAMRKQFHGRLQVSMTICLWAEKGRAKLFGSVGDSTTIGLEREARYVQSNGASWDKPPSIVRRYINAFARPGDVVFDPFAGLGTVPSHCRSLGVRFVGFEQDPDTAERARRRVIATMPPLLLPEEPEWQPALDLVS